MMDVYGWQIQENGLPGEWEKFIITISKLNKSRQKIPNQAISLRVRSAS
jgi:hypothetical protein